jgi:hypothetical protein
MLKFMVVLYRRPDLRPPQFRQHLQEVQFWTKSPPQQPLFDSTDQVA